jgi:hypothetical protein
MTIDTTQKEGTEQTPALESGEQKEETYTKAQLTEFISKEVGKVTAKHSKKYDELKAELEAERRKSLPDPEKIAAELADKDKAISEKDKELSGVKLENAKLRALMKVGVDPEKAESLLKRVVGSTPEEIEADVLELQTLGLLQSKSPGGAQGAGNPGLQPPKKEPNLDEQIVAAEKAGHWNLATQLKLEKQRTIFKR